MFTNKINIEHDIKVFLIFKESKLPKVPLSVKKDFENNDGIISFYKNKKIIILVSLGKKNELDIERLIEIVKNVKLYLKNYPNKIPLFFLEDYMIDDQIQLVKQNYYHFDYKSIKNNIKNNTIKNNTIKGKNNTIKGKNNTKKGKNNTKKGKNNTKNNTKNKFYIFLKNKTINTKDQDIMAESIELLKHLGDEPGNILTPKEYIKRIKSVCKEANLKVTIFDAKKLKKMGMNSILSVSKGSKFNGYLVEISYLPLSNKEQPIVMVGKGITFDTGGISIKSSKKLYEMKSDMIGSAIVLAAMRNASLMNLKQNVIGLLAIAENMPDSNATRPGDVITSYSGKTIEVMNTDAEGRMVMADALSYGMKFKPKLILDISTLTGQQWQMSCGLFGTIMGFNDKTIKKIIKIGKETNDKLVEMPLYQEFINNTKSTIADVKNSEYKCGASTIHGGAFLSNFVDKDSDWIHLDVAGPAFKDERTNGYGVRLLTGIIKS